MIFRILSTLFVFIAVQSIATAQNQFCDPDSSLPFVTDSTHFKVWDGKAYQPFFVKGMNLGISLPGKSPGELDASVSDYYRWFTEIKDAGFNCIRTYTLHYPRFYQTLDSFNLQHPNEPLFVLIGIWLEEELPGYNQDLYFLTDTFDINARFAIDAVHGQAQIGPRFGKAFGTFDTDISKWVLGYIMGREVYPAEVLNTNELHFADRTYNGVYLKVQSAEPATKWVAERMDKVLQYEMNKYGTARPISFSSWPTLDPIDHEFIPGVSYPEEDTAQIDLTKVDFRNAPAGMFASFHAYPYYPPFVSSTEAYRQEVDQYGPNSYLGYIKALRDYHKGMPTMIAEFGTPTSWGSASFSHSGMDHGGVSDDQSGQNALRMFQNMEQANMPGGCYFAWIDEWFKRTWIVDEYDFPLESRQRWHNIMSPEQNFGLKGFRQTNTSTETFLNFSVVDPVFSVKTDATYSFFKMDLVLNAPLQTGDTLWVGIDTYDAGLGESILPNGTVVSNRAEFALEITATDANLYVTEAYDAYGIYFGVDNKPIYEGSQFRSVVSNGGEWKILRWRNDELNDEAIQVVGDLKVNQPNEPLGAVQISGGDMIEVKLPWNLINFVDPSQRVVMHDDTASRGITETRNTDGIALTLDYKGVLHENPSRYNWTTWQTVGNDYEEYFKSSYFVLKDSLPTIRNPMVSKCDYYEVKNGKDTLIVTKRGVLANDFLLDGKGLTASLRDSTTHGTIELFADGSFRYTPVDTFLGIDQFTYNILGPGQAPSIGTEVSILVTQNPVDPDPDPDPSYAPSKNLI
ncbi:MAG: Ig-like domain-containing protein [Luteibaculum sp.]